MSKKIKTGLVFLLVITVILLPGMVLANDGVTFFFSPSKGSMNTTPTPPKENIT